MNSCLGVLIILAILATGLGTCVALAVRSANSPEAAAQRKLDQDLADASRIAKELADEAEKTRIRKLCKLGPAAPVFNVAQDDFRALCRAKVRGMFKSPSSADFSYDDRLLQSDDGGCRMIFSSTVEAMNPFGVKLKSSFTCVFDQRTGDMTASIQ